MSVFVIRAFVKMREHLATNAAILKRLAQIDKSLLVHDSALRDIYQKLLPLLSPRPIRGERSVFIPRAMISSAIQHRTFGVGRWAFADSPRSTSQQLHVSTPLPAMP